MRHGLADPASTDPAEIARSVVVLHSTDPATVYLSIRARAAASVTPAVIEDCLYERRDLVRMLAMRRTVFIVPTESVPVVQAAATDKVAKTERARLIKHLQDLGRNRRRRALAGRRRSLGDAGLRRSGRGRWPRRSCRRPNRG